MSHPTPPKVSMYEPVWQRLKNRETVHIEAAPRHHKRIKRMISKRKDEDLAFKLSTTLDGFRYQLQYSVDSQKPDVLIVKLRLTQWTLGVNDL